MRKPDVQEHWRKEPPPFPLLDQRVQLRPESNQDVSTGTAAVQRHGTVNQNHDGDKADRHERVLIEPIKPILHLRHDAASLLF